MQKLFLRLLCFSLLLSLAACSGNMDKKPTSSKSEVPVNQNERIADKTQPSKADEQSAASTSLSETSNSDEVPTAIDPEQKKMALEVLVGIVHDAKEGRVFRLADGFYVGKTSRTEIHDSIGKPQESDSFEHYIGSMGQASYDFAYDSKEIVKEARYFGTNVERQTNLGGITSEDLREQIGKPLEIRDLPKSDEQSYIYRFKPYELQFVFSTDGALRHVNLLNDN